ncbi:MAG: hypothetical protein ABF254_08540 [Octadecabacter sp.]
MELQNAIGAGQAAAHTTPQSAPPPAQADGRAPADAKAIAIDPTPEVPLPIPASPSQTGLVSKASLSDGDVAQKHHDTGVSAVQRTLKPYGISMLPEKFDAPQQEPAPDTTSE